MYIKEINSAVHVGDFGDINLPLTLDCGQAFRWKELPDKSFYGIASSHETRVAYKNSELIFYETAANEVKNFWLSYFDLYTDYESILEKLCCDPAVAAAVKKYGTIRILQQDPWETLCSFIISACNNIPRIKSIIERFSQELGIPLKNGSAFPCAEVIAGKTAEDLAFLRAGYRAPYIIDASQKVNAGELNFNEIRNMPVDMARKELMKVCGVGRKVADCTLLFSLGFSDVYPVDRHIARADAVLYPQGLPACFNGNKGLAQQYIFHAQRMSNISEG